MRKLSSRPARRLRKGLLAGAATSFALTFAVLAALSLVGWLPPIEVPGGIDVSVVLLLVPAVALFLAILLEVVRAGIVDPAPRTRPVHDRIADWRAGSDIG